MAVASGIVQPHIMGIQTVGQVVIKFRYASPDGYMAEAAGLTGSVGDGYLRTKDGLPLAGIRLDDDFLQANPQIASSVQALLLGGGGIALTNNNRAGQLTLSCVRAGPSQAKGAQIYTPSLDASNNGLASLGIYDKGGTAATVYDPIAIAQCQQAQPGGDSCGADIAVFFNMNNRTILVQFAGCTVAQSGILHLAGNNVPGYGVQWNFLNWGVDYNRSAGTMAARISATGNLL